MEKVTRLSDVLEYLNTNPILKETLALKGGTAINLTIFNLPRLSVDIDTSAIDSITERKIKTDLLPVIRRRDDFELESVKKLVKKYISDLTVVPG